MKIKTICAVVLLILGLHLPVSTQATEFWGGLGAGTTMNPETRQLLLVGANAGVKASFLGFGAFYMTSFSTNLAPGIRFRFDLYGGELSLFPVGTWIQLGARGGAGVLTLKLDYDGTSQTLSDSEFVAGPFAAINLPLIPRLMSFGLEGTYFTVAKAPRDTTNKLIVVMGYLKLWI